MNIKITVCYVLCLLVQLTCTFNFFPKHAYIFTNNNPNSFFGYSVLLQSSANASRLIVGAPRANSSSQLHKNLVEPGSVYSCSLSDKKCTQYLLYLNENTEEKTRYRESYKNKKDNSWLGCSIDGSDDPNGSLVACAPRWVNQARLPNYYFAQGICYYLQDSRQTEKKSEIFLPLLNTRKQGYIRGNETVYYFAYGEAGISVHISKKNMNILIGAPGILQWRGMVVKYDYDNLQTNYNADNIPNPNNVISIDDFSLFGYAISSGIFLKSSNQTWYAAGAPRGNKLNGQVLIYEYEQYGDHLKIHYEMTGRQHGEYFGAALSVGDINGDGVDDLIIGGPLYSTPLKHDTGCAYVFLNDGMGKFTRSVIESDIVSGARFGSAISIIGDINDDNYSDAVISSPYYDNNRGAIFIYHGSKTGLIEKYSQIIVASEIDLNLRGFGTSISRGIDVDNNMYNDIAVGSYLSGHAVIIRTRPVVRIAGTLTTSANQISVHTKSVPFSVCISYSGKHLPETLNIKIIIMVDPLYNRAIISKPHNNYGNKWEVSKSYKYNQLFCDDLSFSMLDYNLDVIQPITIYMEYALEDIETTDVTFCPICPVQDKRVSNSTSLLIYYDTGCGNDLICRPDLAIRAYLDFDKPFIVQGLDEIISINVEITNNGEPAYATKLYAHIPLSTVFYKIPDICHSVHNSLLLCEFGKPLYKNKTMKFAIPIDLSDIKSGEPFNAVLNVTSLGDDINPLDNINTIQREVKAEIQISTICFSDPEQISFDNNNRSKNQNKFPFTHMYILRNLGPSAIHNLKINFKIPQRFNKYEENIFESYTYDTSHLQCYVVGSGSSLFESEINKTGKSNFIPINKNVRNTDAKDPSRMFSKMQENNGNDNILPPNTPLNRMISLSCERDSEVLCIEIECINEVIIKRYEQVTVSFNLVANLALIDMIREDKDVIVITSSILPKYEMITGNWTYAHTLLQGSLRLKYPIKWIIIACASGLIILSIIVFILYKIGFFKRQRHKKLLSENVESTDTQN